MSNQSKQGPLADILSVWNSSHPDVSVASYTLKFLGMPAIHVVMQWESGASIDREISYIEYMRVKDPMRYIVNILNKMYEEGGKKDA